MKHDILIVDDEADIRDLVAGILEDEGYAPRTAQDGGQALEEIQARQPKLVIMDVWLNDSRYDGISLLDILQQNHPDVPVIMISGHGTIETAVAAIKKGAYDFIEKPFKADRLLLMVARALESVQLKGENAALRRKWPALPEVVGKSVSMNQLRQWIRKVGPSNSRVLLMGNMGTDKETVARHLHRLSARGQGPFVVVDCQNSLQVEEELFGAELEQRWGSENRKIGKLEKAHLGTLLLAEVGELPLSLQQHLARFLQEGQFLRLGGQQKVSVDVRVMATTSLDLQAHIAAGKFRQDLYDRLSVAHYLIPPLRQRREDIPELTQAFMAQTVANSHLRACPFAEETLMVLQSYEWMGDVQELRNVVDWALIKAFSQGAEVITPLLLPPEVRGHTAESLPLDNLQNIIRFPLREARELFERYYLSLQLNRFGGNISQTAGFIGMERSALHRKLKLLGIATDREETASGS